MVFGQVLDYALSVVAERGKPSWAARFASLLLGVGLAVILRTLTNQIAPGVSPYAFIYPASLLATLLGGWEAGMLAPLSTVFLGLRFVVPLTASMGNAMNYRLAAAAIALFTGAAIIVVALAFRMATRLVLTERGEKLAERELLYF